MYILNTFMCSYIRILKKVSKLANLKEIVANKYFNEVLNIVFESSKTFIQTCRYFWLLNFFLIEFWSHYSISFKKKRISQKKVFWIFFGV